MLGAAHRLPVDRRRILFIVVVVAVVVAVVAAIGGWVVFSGSPRPAAGHLIAAAEPPATGEQAGLAPCPAMTGGADVTLTTSCRIDRDVTAGNVMISGRATVTVADRSLTLRIRSLMVMNGGRFLAGCPRPLTSRVRIVVTETDRRKNVHGMGAGGISAVGGDFCLVGAYDGPGFSPLAATVRAGARSVTTRQPLKVRPGQRIVLATTDRNPGHSDVVTVTAVSGDGRTLSVRPAVRSGHLCTRRAYKGGKSIAMCGDVAVLDRNVEVSPARGAVGHLMFTGPGTVQVAGVHFDRMGYAKARYGGVHFHVKKDAPTSFMARNSCTNSGARCFVVHATNRATVQDNVAFRTRCSAYLAGEDGVEVGNTYRHNLALNTTACGLEDFDSGGLGPSGFWSAAANQRFYDNHAAGNVGFGFMLDAARFRRPRGVSHNDRIDPSDAHVGAFVGFTAYSIMDGGDPNRCPQASCGAGLMVDVDGRINGCWPDQKNPKWRCGRGDSSYPYYGFGRNNLFHDVTVWNADSAGVWAGRGVGFTGVAVADTRDGLWLADGHVDDSLVVGASGAVANPAASRQCTRMYDFKTVVTRTTFANCGSRAPGGAVDTNFAASDSHNSGVSAFQALTLDNSTPFYAHMAPDPNKCQEGHGTIAWLLDGSTGYGPGHLEYACGPGKGVTRQEWNGVKVVPGRPSHPVFYNGSEQHADPNVVGIPALPGAPAVPAPRLPALIGGEPSP